MTSSPKRPHRNTSRAGLAARDADVDWKALADVMHQDLGQRGLAAYRAAGVALDEGQLRAAAMHLARHATSVGIVTGFCVTLPDRVAAETDGPPGALFLADVLHSLDVRVTIITDRYAAPLVACGAELLGLDRDILCELPIGDDDTTDRWIERFLSEPRGSDLSHLIAVERAGPSHTLESLVAQPRATDAPVERFLAHVPEHERDVCHNMHGEPISRDTAKIHRLFDAAARSPRSITTIGIGDGGNEIGMGRFAWEDLTAAIGGEVAGRIACRIATDYALVAGVSNWGAYALALAAAHLRGQVASNRWLQPAGQRELIEMLVTRAGAVDGRTGRCEPSIDGLPLEVYLQPLAALHAILARG